MRNVFLFCTLFISLIAQAQKYSGQWSGSFDEKTMPGYKTEYVLEIEAKGNSFEGSSITYFIIGGKRYYTICRVSGTIDPLSKTLVSTEVERIKANTPPDFKDCFQIHTLTYFRKESTEQLVGTWKPAKPSSGCGGNGTTLLERKLLVKNNVTQPAPGNDMARRADAQKPAAPTKSGNSNTQSKATPPPSKTAVTQEKNITIPAKPPVTVQNEVPREKPAPAIVKVESRKPVTGNGNTPASGLKAKPVIGLEKRENKIYETITLSEPEIEINLYDNAEVDGDVVTVLFNDEMVISAKPLSDKPISLNLRAVPGKENLLVMYAENLGRVPPNTAIMRIKNGENYYKVLLSADNKNNAGVIFKLK